MILNRDSTAGLFPVSPVLQLNSFNLTACWLHKAQWSKETNCFGEPDKHISIRAAQTAHHSSPEPEVTSLTPLLEKGLKRLSIITIVGNSSFFSQPIAAAVCIL